jgi:hypothetical protein
MELPHDPGALTAPRPTAALRASGALDRAQVESFTSTPMEADKSITGSLSRLVLSYDVLEPTARTTLVATFSSPHPELRTVMHSRGFFEREVRFSRQLAADTLVRTTRCYFADVDVVEGWSLILLEGLMAPPNGSWLAGSSLEEVQAALAAIAVVHAAWWESACLEGRSWLHLAGLTSVAERQQVAIETWAAFLRRLSVPVSAEIGAAGGLVQQHLHATAAYLLEAPPRTLIHHDDDGDNLLLAVARVSTAVGLQPGPPAGFWDVVYPRYALALADLEVGELLETRHAALA